jgi:hypothetical protein
MSEVASDKEVLIGRVRFFQEPGYVLNYQRLYQRDHSLSPSTMPFGQAQIPLDQGFL